MSGYTSSCSILSPLKNLNQLGAPVLDASSYVNKKFEWYFVIAFDPLSTSSFIKFN